MSESKPRLLYARCFGIGNCVMSVPAIKALAERYRVDVLVGAGRDDPGAVDVMLELKATTGCIEDVHVGTAPLAVEYDVAILAIPFDGRWLNGVHFQAARVLDGRPRPGDPNVLGLDSWRRHEVEYQMDNAILLGFDGRTPSCHFSYSSAGVDKDLVYVGMGFKRDVQSFWSKKHWGNDRFVAFLQEVNRLRPSARFVTTGSTVDMAVINDVSLRAKLLTAVYPGLRSSFHIVGSCGSYFGNDTGMAHVAASFNRPTYVMTAFAGSEIKNPPFCDRAKCNPFHDKAMSPEEVAEDFVRFVWGAP